EARVRLRPFQRSANAKRGTCPVPERPPTLCRVRTKLPPPRPGTLPYPVSCGVDLLGCRWAWANLGENPQDDARNRVRDTHEQQDGLRVKPNAPNDQADEDDAQ